MKILREKVRFLLELLEQKDKETKQHSCRVAKVAGTIAVEMGYHDREFLTRIRIGALLHDIGKLIIPDEILFKKEALTEADRRIIGDHPAFSKEIIMLFLPELDIGDMVSDHHKCAEGNGDPGLPVTNGICTEAKICAVADAFDTIRAGRFYCPGKSPEKTIAEIKRCSGMQYDAEVVNALCRTADKIEKLFYLKIPYDK